MDSTAHVLTCLTSTYSDAGGLLMKTNANPLAAIFDAQSDRSTRSEKVLLPYIPPRILTLKGAQVGKTGLIKQSC